MKFGARKRWAVLVVLLTAALSAAAWVREGDKTAEAEVIEAPARPSRTAGGPPVQAGHAAERVHLEKLRARPSAGGTDDAFATRSWRKPAPKLSAAEGAVAVVAPSAPPLPFVYMGKLLSDEARAVFLTNGERNLIVHEGDVIDATYRVDKLADEGLTFVHLPTGIQQHLAFAEAQ